MAEHRRAVRFMDDQGRRTLGMRFLPHAWREDDKVLGYPPVNQLFMRFNTSGKLLQLWSVPLGEDGKERPGDLNWAHGLALDSKGNIYAVDIKGKRAQKFVPQES